MLDTRNLYRSEEFSRAWHERQLSYRDFLRKDLMNQIVEEEMGDISDLAILDAGCGDGFFLGDLLEKKPSFLTAFDISPYLVRIANDRFPLTACAVGDITVMPYRSEIFDVVLCYNVLMALLDAPRAMQEISRVAKPNGTIHIVIVHPLYNLFANDRLAQTESTMERLRRYVREEAIHVTTIPGFENFVAYRRPLAYYLNAFSGAGLFLSKTIEIPIDEAVAETNQEGMERIGIPLFTYFRLRKIEQMLPT